MAIQPEIDDIETGILCANCNEYYPDEEIAVESGLNGGIGICVECHADILQLGPEEDPGDIFLAENE